MTTSCFYAIVSLKNILDTYSNIILSFIPLAPYHCSGYNKGSLKKKILG